MRSSYRRNALRATRTLVPLLMFLSNATTTAALALAQTEGDVPVADDNNTGTTTTMVVMTVMATVPPSSTITSTATPHPGSTTTTTLAAVTSTAAATPSPSGAPAKQNISPGLLAAIIVMCVFVIGGLMAMALISCLQLRRARRREREADVAAQDTRAAARRRRAAAHIGVGPRVDTPNFFSSAAAVASGEKVEEWLDEDGGRGNQRTWPGYRSQSRLGMQSDDKKDAPRWRESTAWKIGRAFSSNRRTVPSEFLSIEAEASGLSKTLKLLAETLFSDDNYGSHDDDSGSLLISRASTQTRRGVDIIVNSCSQTLRDLENLVEDYQLTKRNRTSGGWSVERSWSDHVLENYDKMVWTKGGGNIGVLQSLLNMHKSCISLTINALQSRSLARLEHAVNSMADAVNEVHSSKTEDLSARIQKVNSIVVALANDSPSLAAQPEIFPARIFSSSIDSVQYVFLDVFGSQTTFTRSKRYQQYTFFIRQFG
ncbi:uncharacterized protein BKA78DRAFT_348623 [Phyllosticta capitalensis]|uniref:uncharacterized protein n=1 Tax=Phyllosticta capitalensis TaxID=121624 RepID=UPI0031314EC8